MIDTKKFISTFVCIFIAGMTMAAPAEHGHHKPSKVGRILRAVDKGYRIATGQPTYETHGYEVRPVDPGTRNGWVMPTPSSTWTVPAQPPRMQPTPSSTRTVPAQPSGMQKAPSSTRTVPTPPRGPRR